MRKVLIILSLCLTVFSSVMFGSAVRDWKTYQKLKADQEARDLTKVSAGDEDKTKEDENKVKEDENNGESKGAGESNKSSDNKETVSKNYGIYSSQIAFAMEKANDKDSIVVLGVPESQYVEVKKSPDSKSKTVGKIYGSLVEVKVLGGEGSYALIEGTDYFTQKKIKGYIPASKLKVKEVNPNYSVTVDISDQITYVYKDGELIREIPVSTGLDTSETIRGRYVIGARNKSFFSKRFQEGAYNWVRFNYDYLFHSVPFDENREFIEEEAQKLGQKASHGCVRMSLEDSEWFYKTIPSGTEVVVQD